MYVFFVIIIVTYFTQLSARAPINNFPSWQTFRSSQEGDATKEAYVSQLLEELDSAETIDAILLLVDEVCMEN